MPIRRVDDSYARYSLEQVLGLPESPQGKFTVQCEDGLIDFLYEDKGFDTTVVFFHAALGPKVKTLPVFSGQIFSKSIKANRLFISDPTLSLFPRLRLAWYSGSVRQPRIQLILSNVIKAITGKNRTVYFGASGGGFASLYYSSLHPGSTALPINPQTIIGNYTRASVTAWTDIAWGESNRKNGKLELPRVTTDLRTIYNHPTENTVIYVQNDGDVDHVAHHFIPFLDSLHSDNVVHVLKSNSGHGHIPPPKEYLTNLLEFVVAEEKWEKLTFDQIEKHANAY